METENKLIFSPIDEVLKNSMIPYAESVILDRALPRVEDGLKPVQRRILYDMLIQGGIEARGQIITRWSRGDTRYTRTDYYKMFRNGSIKYNKIPIDGSSRFDNAIMSSIEPFHYKDLVPYNHAFLSGFLAERYDIDGDTLIGNAVNRAVESTKQVFLSDTGNYSNKTIFNSSLLATDVTKKYILLPVWMVNVKYKDKYYLQLHLLVFRKEFLVFSLHLF